MSTSIEIHSLPAMNDNYIHIIHDLEQKQTIVVDPAVTKPVQDFMKSKSWNLTHIFLTHHHGDHIGGVDGLKEIFLDCKIYGFGPDQHRLPPLTDPLYEGSRIKAGNLEFEVWHLPGHTAGHIAFISKNPTIAFTGDVLFGMGCGRVFEGTYQEMFTAISRLKQLNPKTRIFCTHEYTISNGKFAKHQFPDSFEISNHLAQMISLRETGAFTVPLLLEQELRVNPFLLAKDLKEFSHLRDARNKW